MWTNPASFFSLEVSSEGDGWWEESQTQARMIVISSDWVDTHSYGTCPNWPIDLPTTLPYLKRLPGQVHIKVISQFPVSCSEEQSPIEGGSRNRPILTLCDMMKNENRTFDRSIWNNQNDVSILVQIIRTWMRTKTTQLHMLGQMLTARAWTISVKAFSSLRGGTGNLSKN